MSALLLAALLGVSSVKAPVPSSIASPPSKRAVASAPPPESQESKRAKAEAQIAAWRGDPVQFVRDQFGAEPDEWQKDALAAVAKNPKVAMSACKGPGKSCLLAWTIWWFIATHPHAQVIAVSITADNLKDNLWKELSVWQSKSELLKESFVWGAERIKSKKYPGTWWVSARAFAKSATPEQQADTLAGFHGQNILIVLDEIGSYPPGVLPAAEAIFSNEVNAKLVVAGNPTTTQGPLYRIVKQPKGWVVIKITGDPDDPKRSPRISLKWALEEIEKWGRDSPYIMVNILGEFPPGGDDQLISVDAVLDAMRRDLPALAYNSDAIVWGLDPSRSERSVADEAALARRQGSLVRRIITWRGLNGPELASAVARLIHEAEDAGEAPDALFVDVGGVGASCYDHLVLLGFDDLVIPVDFGGSAEDARFGNKRSEMWYRMGQAINGSKSMPSRMCLPNDTVLQEELVAPTCWWGVKNKKTAFWLESKESMKERGVASPNRGDAVALTYSEPVARKRRSVRELNEGRAATCATDYDPFARRG